MEYKLRNYVSDDRLGIPPVKRVAILTGIGAAAGGVMGFMLGFRSGRLRFLAENAHRLPTTSTGWYFYHKSKNNYAALNGAKQAAKYGGLMAGGALTFAGTEAIVDAVQSTIAFPSTILGTMAMAGAIAYRFKIRGRSLVKLQALAFVVGASSGLIQDYIHKTQLGKDLWYMKRSEEPGV